MGYLHIDNLYKNARILEFKKCYALEKIHGTSAHIAWRDGRVHFFSGGESFERFKGLFDEEKLRALFEEWGVTEAVIFGEAYGGKQQGMSKTYGTELKFIAFDVKVGDCWLDVDKAAAIVTHRLGLEFVDHVLIDTDMDAINAERDKPSTQAQRNGIVEPQIREGVVLRPPFEVRLNNGDRVIVKHKREEFSERGRPKVDLDPTVKEARDIAERQAEEWVTPMRLFHVIDHLIATRDDKEISDQDIPALLAGMVEDVLREGAGEVVDTKDLRKAISRQTVVVYKQTRLDGLLHRS